MHRVLLASLLTLTLALTLRAADWPQFRGPAGNGHADAKLVTEWDAKKNVSWRKEIPGLGWSSPVVADGKIYLTTAVQQGRGHSLRALCLDAKTSKTIWDKEVFTQEATAPGIHRKNSHASPTPVIEGDRLYVHFGHMGTACLNAKDGSQVWANRKLSYSPVHGNGGSPVVAGNFLIFSTDGLDKQEVVALDKATGKLVWAAPRKQDPDKPFSFSTPLVITVNGQEQVISAGSGVVMALEPKTGKEIWRATYGDGYSVVPRPVFANGLVYLSTGYDTPTVIAVKPDGKGT
jgi:outer membrane protein assembly factor BamB